MIMQPVYRKHNVSKSSVASQRTDLSEQSVFVCTRPLTTYAIPDLQSKGSIKMPFMSKPGLL